MSCKLVRKLFEVITQLFLRIACEYVSLESTVGFSRMLGPIGKPKAGLNRYPEP